MTFPSSSYFWASEAEGRKEAGGGTILPPYENVSSGEGVGWCSEHSEKLSAAVSQ